MAKHEGIPAHLALPRERMGLSHMCRLWLDVRGEVVLSPPGIIAVASLLALDTELQQAMPQLSVDAWMRAGEALEAASATFLTGWQQFVREATTIDGSLAELRRCVLPLERAAENAGAHLRSAIMEVGARTKSGVEV